MKTLLSKGRNESEYEMTIKATPWDNLVLGTHVDFHGRSLNIEAVESS